jgi:mycofactocin precursor
MSPTTTHHDPQATAADDPRPGHASATVGAPVADGTSVVTEDLVEEDLLVEDVSIDGMCGVY